MSNRKTIRDYVTNAPIMTHANMTYDEVYEHLSKKLPIDKRVTVEGRNSRRYYFWIQRPDGGYSLTFTYYAKQ